MGSAVRADNESIRASVNSREASIISDGGSQRVSLSDFVFSFDRHVQDAMTPVKSYHHLAGKAPTEGTAFVNDAHDDKVSFLPNAGALSPTHAGSKKMSTSEVTVLQRAFKGLIAPKALPKPLRGLRRASFLPVIKVTQDVEHHSSLAKAAVNDRQEILLLGASGSGKTTLLKSFSLLAGSELSETYRVILRALLPSDIEDRVNSVLRQTNSRGSELENSIALDPPYSLSDPHYLAEYVQDLWLDPSFREACRPCSSRFIPKDTEL